MLNEAECSEARVKLALGGVDHTAVRTQGSDRYPQGCYQTEDGKLRHNSLSSAQSSRSTGYKVNGCGNKGFGNTKCICKLTGRAAQDRLQHTCKMKAVKVGKKLRYVLTDHRAKGCWKPNWPGHNSGYWGRSGHIFFGKTTNFNNSQWETEATGSLPDAFVKGTGRFAKRLSNHYTQTRHL